MARRKAKQEDAEETLPQRLVTSRDIRALAQHTPPAGVLDGSLADAAASPPRSEPEAPLDAEASAADSAAPPPPPPQQQQQHLPPLVRSELSELLADTPAGRLRAKEEELAAEAALGEGADPWRLLQLQQELLALAKVQALLSAQHKDHRPLLLPTAHYQLAQRYADLGCLPQASEHLQRAIDELPPHGQSQPGVRALLRQVHVCMAETLLQAQPPKPQVALQHLQAACGGVALEQVEDLELAVLASQALGTQGDAKLNEARSTRLARNRLAATLEELDAALSKAEAAKRVHEAAALRQRVGDAEAQALAEDQYEARLVDQAMQLFDRATDTLYNVTQHEERRLEEALERQAMRRHPLVQLLRRQLCALSARLADCHALSGNTTDQERALGEIVSAHEAYGCVPPGTMARVLKELGAAQLRSRKYDGALDSYERLRELQEERYDEYAHRELAVGECFKLSGDVFVAMREFGRAREHFDQAFSKFVVELGPDHQLTLDLEHRLRELEQYADVVHA